MRDTTKIIAKLGEIINTVRAGIDKEGKDMLVNIFPVNQPQLVQVQTVWDRIEEKERASDSVWDKAIRTLVDLELIRVFYGEDIDSWDLTYTVTITPEYHILSFYLHP